MQLYDLSLVLVRGIYAQALEDIPMMVHSCTFYDLQTDGSNV